MRAQQFEFTARLFLGVLAILLAQNSGTARAVHQIFITKWLEYRYRYLTFRGWSAGTGA